jgi:hypothetical protein
MKSREATIHPQPIESSILLIRGHRVMLDAELARLYRVSTKRLNEQVKRNKHRFPADFMFRLDSREAEGLRSQFATSKANKGGRRYLPFAFTEHGAVMLATVLNSPIAVQASIQVVRAFVKLREAVGMQRKLVHKLLELEKRMGEHDSEIAALFEAIRQLMRPVEKPRRQIGFHGR